MTFATSGTNSAAHPPIARGFLKHCRCSSASMGMRARCMAEDCAGGYVAPRPFDQRPDMPQFDGCDTDFEARFAAR